MNRLGILHISDLHFGYEFKGKTIKKIPISRKLKTEIGEDDPRAMFLDRVLTLLEKREVDAIAFTGDAGWNNNPNSMDSAIIYLSKLRERLNIAAEHVIVAPGNHDLDRAVRNKKELTQLINRCVAAGFTFAKREAPACITIKSTPIIAINTCLGGTEQAVYGLPEDIMKLVKKLVKDLGDFGEKRDSEIPDEMRSQFKSVDIPAIGQNQFGRIDKCLEDSAGNCAIILGHHNLLPTHRLIIRPYAEIVEAGRLFFNLIGGGRRILFLHGHTHCDTAIVARSPDNMGSGFIACLGGTGLHRLASDAVASASYIQIYTDNESKFLAAVVIRFQQNGVDFIRHYFPIWDDAAGVGRSSLEIENLPVRTSLYLDDVGKQLNENDLDLVATELLRRRSFHQIEIQDVDKSMNLWRITRL